MSIIIHIGVYVFWDVKHQIQGIPALKLFHKRIEVETFAGIQPLSKLKTAILRDAA